MLLNDDPVISIRVLVRRILRFNVGDDIERSDDLDLIDLLVAVIDAQVAALGEAVQGSQGDHIGIGLFVDPEETFFLLFLVLAVNFFGSFDQIFDDNRCSRGLSGLRGVHLFSGLLCDQIRELDLKLGHFDLALAIGIEYIVEKHGQAAEGHDDEK